MPVSGLVVSLSDEPRLRDEALAAIGGEPHITRGILEANQLAIVLDTASNKEDKRLCEWLNSLAGVIMLEVAFVGFEQEGETEMPPEQAGQVSSATTCNPTPGRKENPEDGC